MNNAIKKKRFDELEPDVPSSMMGAGAANSVATKTTAGYKPIVPTPNQNVVPEQLGGNGTSAGTMPGSAGDYLDQALEMLSKQPEVSYTPGTYQSQYSEQIDAIINDILNSKYQGYDPTTDPTFSQYKKTYLREADRTAEDVLGQYAAMTGGMPSTAAITAASQAGNVYKGQLADKIPELEAAAYDRYLSELAGKRQNLSDLTALEELAYGRFADEENRKLTEYQQAQTEFDTALSRLLQGAEIAQGKEDSEASKALASDLANTGLSEDTMLKLWEYAIENDLPPAQVVQSYYEIASAAGGSDTGTKTDGEISGVSKSIQSKAASFNSNTDLAAYLDGLTANNIITEDEADALFAEYMTPDKAALRDRDWDVEDDGGTNWFGVGIDADAKVKDQYGNVYTLDKLRTALMEEGMTRSEATDYLLALQKKKGI